MATSYARYDFKCAVCKTQVRKNDEIGFTIIKNKAVANGFNTVAICVKCYDQEMRDQASEVKYDS